MISRGHFIGQIIDEFTGISSQVRARSDLKLYDLNGYLENFCRDVLNIIMDLKLVNLNDDKANSKGLDLADEKAKVGFQITSTSNITKIHNTLEKSVGYLPKISTIYILILDKRQGKYKLDEQFTKPFNFSDENILDFESLTKMAISLPLNKLQELWELISKEIVRVKMELEIPDSKGKFPNDIEQYIEPIPKPTYNGVASYFKFFEKEFDYIELTETEVDSDFKELQIALKKLPRMTRQLLVVMIERSEFKKGAMHINVDYLDKVSSLPDLKGDIRLLTEADFVSFMESDNHEVSATWRLEFGYGKNDDNFLLNVLEYVNKGKTTLNKVITGLDFTDFA